MLHHLLFKCSQKCALVLTEIAMNHASELPGPKNSLLNQFRGVKVFKKTQQRTEETSLHPKIEISI